MSIAIAETVAREQQPAERGGARRADPGARAAARPPRRPADPAPVAVVLRPVGDVPRGVAPEIHLR